MKIWNSKRSRYNELGGGAGLLKVYGLEHLAFGQQFHVLHVQPLQAVKHLGQEVGVTLLLNLKLGSGEVVMLPGGLEPLKHPDNLALLGDDDGVQVAKVYHGLSQYVVLDLYGMAVF